MDDRQSEKSHLGFQLRWAKNRKMDYNIKNQKWTLKWKLELLSCWTNKLIETIVKLIN